MRFSFVFKLCTRVLKKKKAYLLGFFPLGMPELLPLLGALGLLLSGQDPNKLCCTVSSVAEEVELSSDLEQERIYYKLNAKCTLNRPFIGKSI